MMKYEPERIVNLLIRLIGVGEAAFGADTRYPYRTSMSRGNR